MSKLLMVTPDERQFLTDAGDRLPLGALYVATAAEKAGHEVSFMDMNHRTEEELFKEIKRFKPEIMGYSCISSPSFKQIDGLIAKIVDEIPEIINVVGGYHANARPDDFTLADYVIKGDGEKAIVDILNGKEPSKELTRVDFNENPVPDRSLVDVNEYQMKQNNHPTATMITSRGCPMNCIFCGNYDRKVRFRNLDNIDTELKNIAELGYKGVYFLDDAFTMKKSHAIGVSKIAKKYGLPFRCTTRADMLDEEIVRELSANGLEIASIGIESGNDEVLRLANKRTTTGRIEEAVTLLNKYNVPTKGFFIFGLPGETPIEAQQSIDFANHLKDKGLKYADFYAMTPFPGTPIYNTPEKFKGRVIHHDWDKYLEIGKDDIQPAWETDTMSAEQIKYFTEKAKAEWKS